MPTFKSFSAGQRKTPAPYVNQWPPKIEAGGGAGGRAAHRGLLRAAAARELRAEAPWRLAPFGGTERWSGRAVDRLCGGWSGCLFFRVPSFLGLLSREKENMD